MSTHAQEIAILADICDSVDPEVDPDAQTEAAIRAAKSDPEFAIVAATSLMRGLIEGISDMYGPEAVAILARLRAKVAQFPR